MRRATLVIGALVAVLVAVMAGVWFTKWRAKAATEAATEAATKCLATTDDMCLVESNGPCVYALLTRDEAPNVVPMNAAGRASLVALFGGVGGVPAVGKGFQMEGVGRALTDAELMGIAQALYSGGDTKTRATMAVVRFSTPSAPNAGLIAVFTREGDDARIACDKTKWCSLPDGGIYATVLPTALVRARPDLNSDSFCS